MLSDPEKRSMYDRFGHAAAGGADGFARGFEGFGFGGLGDIFDAFFGGSVDAHPARPHARRRRPQGASRSRSRRPCSASTARLRSRRPSCARRATACASEPGTQPEKLPALQRQGETRRVQQSVFGQFVNVAPCERCRGEGRIVTTPCKHCKGIGPREAQAQAAGEDPRGRRPRPADAPERRGRARATAAARAAISTCSSTSSHTRSSAATTKTSCSSST